MPCPTDPHRTQALRCLSALMVVATLALSGCALPAAPAAAPAPEPATAAPPPAPPTRFVTVLPPPSPPEPEDLAARRLLQFHDQLRGLTAPELAREQQRLAAAGTPDDTLALALLLSQTRQPGDLARAMALLDPLARADTAHAGLARLLQSRLNEQQRLESQAERQAQQLREQQRRLDQLNQQLEALRAIERSLGTRPPAAPAAATPRTP